MILKIIPVLLLGAATLGCNRDEPEVRPSGVSPSAVWAGGSDGGAYVDCVPSRNGEPNACTVYSDATGDVWISGKFGLKPDQHGASATQLKYSGADGEGIYLQNDLVLSPVSISRPESVPKSALLAENGVYADCRSNGSDLYQCSLFLAADGQKIASAAYRCESLPSPPCSGHMQPKYADRSAIELQNAGTLKALEEHP